MPKNYQVITLQGNYIVSAYNFNATGEVVNFYDENDKLIAFFRTEQIIGVKGFQEKKQEECACQKAQGQQQ